MRDGRTGQHPDSSGTDNSTVSGFTSQPEFNSANNRVIHSINEFAT